MKNRVKELSILNKMTQKQLADIVFVSSMTIISLEKVVYNPSIMLAYKLSIVFGMSIENLFCLEDNLKNETKNL